MRGCLKAVSFCACWVLPVRERGIRVRKVCRGNLEEGGNAKLTFRKQNLNKAQTKT